MAAQDSNGVASGPASQVKIHLTSRDENIQLPQDTGAILVSTGKHFVSITLNKHLARMSIRYLLDLHRLATTVLTPYTQTSSATNSPHW